jgi:hypothetical protein
VDHRVFRLALAFLYSLPHGCGATALTRVIATLIILYLVI